MFKLVLEKAEKPEIKLSTSDGTWKKQDEFQKNIYFCCINYAKAFDCVDHKKLWKILHYESWTIKKAECRKIEAFELWCWRRLLRVPWTARRSNQSILKKISPGCSLEGLMLTLKLQYFSIDAESWLIWKDLDAGKDWRREEKGTTEDEMAGGHHRLDGREFEWTLGVGDRQGGLACCNSWGRKESDMTEWLNWTKLNAFFLCSFFLHF